MAGGGGFCCCCCCSCSVVAGVCGAAGVWGALTVDVEVGSVALNGAVDAAAAAVVEVEDSIIMILDVLVNH